MKKVIKQWLAFTLAIGALVSCGEDRNEPSSTAEGSGETVTLSLSAEVSMDDSDLRAINYKLGTNANGKVVPLPEFTDGQLVDVHTIIKSNRAGSVPVVKTLKWSYNAASRKLVLSPKGTSASGASYTNDIAVSNFSNDGGAKWYISGLIGGVLNANAKTVKFEGTRVLNGVSDKAGDIVGNLNVPYAFGWTELTIDTKSQKVGTSYVSAKLPTNVQIKFSPLGSLIAYKLGNKQTKGVYTFTPSSFYVNTNVFFDKGTFDLNTAIPSSGNTHLVLPRWSEDTPTNLVYSFAKNHEPGVINHQRTASKTYYAWVMPNAAIPAIAATRVMLKGKSSVSEQFSKTLWFTDYKVKASKLTRGRVHVLNANVTDGRPLLPIDYVVDYNLAGGEGLTSVPTNASHYPGVTGPLRFAGSHDTNTSGYYNNYVLWGEYHEKDNPNSRSLLNSRLVDTDGSTVILSDKYFIPAYDQWFGVLPAIFNLEAARLFGEPMQMGMKWNESADLLDRDELMRFDIDGNIVRQSYKSDYSRNLSVDPNNAVIYAIRFKARGNADLVEATMGTPYPSDDVSPKSAYPSAKDNSLKSAFRYTRIGNDWKLGDTSNNLTARMIVDVVYLGEDDTQLSTISNPAWWAQKAQEGKIISRTLNVSGDLSTQSSSPSYKLGYQSYRGAYATDFRHIYEQRFFGAVAKHRTQRHYVIDYSNMDASYNHTLSQAITVRLFYKKPVVE